MFPTRLLSNAQAQGYLAGGLLLAQAFDATSDFLLPVSGLIFLGCIQPHLGRRVAMASPFDAALALFLVAYVAAACLGRDPIRSLSLSAPVLPALALYLAVANGACRQTILWSLLAASVLVVARVVLAGSPDPTMAVAHLGVSWLVVPNDLLVLACLLPWVSKALERCRNARLLSLGYGLVVFAIGWRFESRLTMCASMAVGVMNTFARRGGWSRRRLAWCGSGVVVAGFGAVLASPKSFASMEARWELWQEATCTFLRHPWLGVGPHNFVIARVECASSQLAAIDDRAIAWPHNLPLEILAETGVIGFFVLTAVSISVLRLVFNCMKAGDREVLAPAMTLLALGIGCTVEVTLLRLWVWTIAALALGWVRASIDTESARRARLAAAEEGL